jgi:surface protein
MPNGLLGRPAPVTTPRGKKQRFGYDPSNLTLVYDTSLEPANLQVSAPLDGVVNVVIDWGDGTSEAHTSSGYKLHTYAAPGVYVVQISGRMTAMRHSAVATPGLSKLIRCLSFGDLGITSLNEAFRNCINLIECPPSLPASVTTMTLCFFSCAQFNDPNVCLWNTRNVTAMTQMFQGATRFNQPVGGWDTSSVTTMQGMFVACIAFNQPIGNWDTRRVISFVNMFNAATSFNQQIGGWNTSSTSAIRTMFSGATSFRQTLHGWNMSNVSSMDQLFVNSNYNQDVSNWDIRRATTLSSSFTPFWGNENYSAALIAWAALPDTDLAAVPITAFAVSGARTRVTNSGNHGVVVGSRVRITGTTNYNGDYNVAATPSGNTFEIDTPFVANDATGTMAVRRSLNVILNPGASVKYLPDAAAARDTLINTYGWVITDGGQV